jgi:hypothetical protein
MAEAVRSLEKIIGMLSFFVTFPKKLLDMKPKKKWDLRLNADSYSDDSSDDGLQPHDPHIPDISTVIPPPPAVSKPRLPSFVPPVLSSDDSGDDANSDHSSEFVSVFPPPPSGPDSPHFVPSAAARRTRELLHALSSDNEVPPPSIASVDVPSDTSDSDTEPAPPSKRVLKTLRHRDEPPVVKAPKSSRKKAFLKTVKSIHEFFKGEYPIPVILQAIHGCAGDYKRAVVKLTQGYTGTPILKMPVSGEGCASPSEIRVYLRGS